MGEDHVKKTRDSGKYKRGARGAAKQAFQAEMAKLKADNTALKHEVKEERDLRILREGELAELQSHVQRLARKGGSLGHLPLGGTTLQNC